jgi:molybdate/tungstate transport system substrate-binding protein
MHSALRTRPALALIASVLTACGRSEKRASTTGGTLVVYNAGSLARPLRAALDTFAARNGVTIHQENAGSLETARKLTELHKIPDVIGLADYEVFPQLLMPQYVTWYAQFAHNRMVIAYTDRSRYASEINADNWWKIFLRPGVQVGRADPNLDPNGYRTLLTIQLAERHYKQPKLYQRLIAALPQRNIRPKEADLVGLLQAGELDYIWSYESIAQAANLRYLRLPEAIDLSTPAESTFYAQASVRVTGKTPADSITFRGQPIVYGLSVPKSAPHPELAERFAAFVLSPDGRRVLRQAKLDALDKPIIIGSGVPPAIAKVTATQ